MTTDADLEKFQRLFDKARRTPVAGPYHMWVAHDGQVYEVTGVIGRRHDSRLGNRHRKQLRNRERAFWLFWRGWCWKPDGWDWGDP